MKTTKSIMKTIVIKIGGAEGIDFSTICADALYLISHKHRLVLLHGGSAETNHLGEALGYPPRFIVSPSGYSSRYTDRRTLEIFTMAVNGKLNTTFVSQLQAYGVNALGLSGLDGRLIVAERKKAVVSVENGRRRVIRDDFTGKISDINSALLETLLASGFVPVISPLAISPEGQALNVDADRAAAMIAAAMKADALILLTAVAGLMRDFPNENTLIKEIPVTKLDLALDYAQGRMKKKILGAQEALAGGVHEIIISDGRVPLPISRALEGKGTRIG